ncbi:MAG: hypothetical protein AAFX99_12705 [Myxococcota bacterium]
MKLPITLIIEQERRRREKANSDRPRIELPLRHIEEPPRPKPHNNSIHIIDPNQDTDDETERGVLIISIFGDDDEDDDND